MGTEDNSRDNLRKKFCGYLKYIIALVEHKRSNDVNVIYFIETLYQMVNGDNIFDSALVSFV